MGQRLLLIEDDPDLIEVLTYRLQQDGYEVIVARDGQEGLRKAFTQTPDLVILDLMIPPPDGLDVCRSLRAHSHTSHIPVLMLTAKSEETDELVGFAVGADDYVTKPFSVKVLLHRIKVLLKRITSPEPNMEVIQREGICLDKRRHQVTYEDDVIALTPTEFRLLETLMKQPGRAFTRQDLISTAISDGAIVLDRTIDVHVKALRKKLGAAGSSIETVRGVGYRFRDSKASTG